MKYFLVIFFIIPIGLKAQSDFKKNIPSFVSTFVAGMADGLNQTLEFHYNDFKRVFPNANDNYWNPQVSWVNKYKNGNSADGPKYMGSTTYLVWTTDGYHLTRFIEHATIATSITLRINFKEKKKWYIYVFDITENLFINRLGFVVVYSGLHNIK
jgi:hypothetical protein